MFFWCVHVHAKVKILFWSLLLGVSRWEGSWNQSCFCWCTLAPMEHNPKAVKPVASLLCSVHCLHCCTCLWRFLLMIIQISAGMSISYLALAPDTTSHCHPCCGHFWPSRRTGQRIPGGRFDSDWGTPGGLQILWNLHEDLAHNVWGRAIFSKLVLICFGQSTWNLLQEPPAIPPASGPVA